MTPACCTRPGDTWWRQPPHSPPTLSLGQWTVLGGIICRPYFQWCFIHWHSHANIKEWMMLYYAPRKISGEHIVAALSVRPSVRSSVRQSVRTTHSCPAHNFVIWSGISKLFYRNDHHVETTCRAQHLGPYLEGQDHSLTLQQYRVRPIASLFEVGFRNYSPEMITILKRRVARKFGSLPWRSRSQRDLAAKSCPAHNFVIWSRISKIFHRNDYHIETTCGTQI